MTFFPTLRPGAVRVALAAALALGAPATAGAAVLFSEDFDEVPAGSNNNFTAFDSFTVTAGSVDAFTDGGFGLSCPSLGCVDLDGSTLAAGRMKSTTVFTFEGGKTYRLEANVSGNQRGGASDVFTIGITGFGSSAAPIDPAQPFEARGITFSSGPATSDFSGRIFLENDGGDNVGVIIDSVTLIEVETGVVPLPATLPLAAAALGLLGLVRRRA